MAGLLEKDFRLLFERRSALLLFIIISIFMAITTDGTFIIGYVTFLCAIFSISTISYDEHDNGYLFLMTLPIDCKTYVRSKYVICFGLGLAGWLLSLIISLVSSIAMGREIIISDFLAAALTIIPVTVIMLDLMIPLHIKYGAEKGRIFLAIIAGGVAAIALVAGKIAASIQLPPEGMIRMIDALPSSVFAGITFVLVLVATAISVNISYRVMKNKTF